MRQYLAEGLIGAFPFIVDRTRPPVTESRPNGAVITRIPGRFSVCDCINGNNRRYRKRVWEKNMQQGSVLQESIKRNGAFGLLEHPKDGVITLESPISHQVTKAELVETRDASGKPVFEVTGEISLYNPALIPESAKLLGLIEGGYNPMVSSRGYGSLTKASDGVDEVEDDYVCEGWDVVIKPSFETAELTPNRSATNATMAAPAAPNPQAESASNPKTPATILKESTPSTAAPTKPVSEPKPKKTMELNDFKARIEALRGAAGQPGRITESMSQIEELHQQIAEWGSADTKRSWEESKLHKALDTITEGCAAAIDRPKKEVKRLNEQNLKLMRVVDAVAKTAVTYKKKLSETLKATGSSKKLIEEITRRGQGWQRIAESRKTKYLGVEKDLDTACEALDLMAERYHRDMTELGRRLIVLEFKEKAQTPEIQKALKESTRLRHVVAIRETLEGKPAKKIGEAEALKQPTEGETPGKAFNDKKRKDAGSPDGDKVASEPGKVTTESALKSGGAGVINEARVLKPERADMSIRSVNESVDLVQRLSKAHATT